MREILFKAKSLEEYNKGKWVEGDLVHLDDGIVKIQSCGFDCDYDEIIDPKTVCEYTGLQDSIGNKIYENDIVNLSDTHGGWYAIVEFGNPNCKSDWGWQLRPICKTKVNTDILLWVEMEDSFAYCTVMGNIFDNPELSKGE